MISRLLIGLTAIGFAVLATLVLGGVVLCLHPSVSGGFRAALVARLSEYMGYQVTAEAVRLGLSGLRPRLHLEDVAFRQPPSAPRMQPSGETGEPILEAEAIDLELDFSALLQGAGIRVAGIRLRGGRLIIAPGIAGQFPWPRPGIRGGDGSLRQQPDLAGPKELAARRLLESFLTQGWVEWIDSEVLLVDAGAKLLWHLADIKLRLANAGERHWLDLQSSLLAPLPGLSTSDLVPNSILQTPNPSLGPLPPYSAGAESSSGPRLHLALQLEGPPADPLSWQGQGYGRIEGRELGWLWPAVWGGTDRIATSGGSLAAWFEIQAGRLQQALVEVQIQGLRRSVGESSREEGDQEDSAWDLNALAQIRRLDTGWQVLVQGGDLGIPEARIAELGVELRLDADGSARELVGRIAGTRLDLFGRLLAAITWTLPGPVEPFLDRSSQGSLDELRLWIDFGRDEGKPHWQFQGHLSGLGITAQTDRLGFAGLDLWISGDQDRVWGHLASQGLDLSLPSILDRPVHLDRLSGRFDWSRLKQGGWQLRFDQVGLENADLLGRMRLELAWPVDAPGPDLELSASFQGTEGAPFRPYLPVGLMHPEWVRWLESSIRPGRVTEGRLYLQGSLDRTYRFRLQPRLQLDLAFADVRLDYWPGWPGLTAARGHLHLRDQSLGVRITQARLLDSDLSARLDLPQLERVERLPIHIEVEGPFGDGQRFLNAIPGDLQPSTVSQTLELSGQARWVLDLEIPLVRGATPGFRGQLSWPGPARLALCGTPIQLDALTGVVLFNERGIEPSTLTAQLLRPGIPGGQGLRIALASRDGGLALGITAPALDLDDPFGGKTGALTPDAFGLKRLELAIDRLRLAGMPLGLSRLEAVHHGLGWRVRIAAKGITGELDWPARSEAQARLHLDRLDLQSVFPFGPGHEPTEPKIAAWPPLAIRIDQVNWGTARLGRLDLQLQPESGGVRRLHLVLDRPGLLRIEGRGAWDQGADGVNGQLTLEASSPDPGRLLSGLDERSAIAAGYAHAHLELSWSGTPWTFEWRQAAGLLQLEFGPGRLLRVEPGVGRLLGIVDLGSIGRRLALDFSDLHAPGFAFERLAGRIAINQGLARIEDLQIEGPSARIWVLGTTDLIGQRLDQRILVEPKLGPGLALASAVAGGPMVGAAVWLVDRAAGNPLARLGRYRYRLTGSWDDPQWIRLGWEPLASLDASIWANQAADPAVNHFLDHP